MKRVFLSVFLAIVLLLVNTSVVFPIVGYNFDIRLKLLLNDETTPFFSSTVRYNFIEKGMQKCAMLCDAVSQFRRISWVPASIDTVQTIPVFRGYSKNVSAVWLRVSATSVYSLMHIRQKDIGLKKIATIVPNRYWYETNNTYIASNRGTALRVYPANDATLDTVWVFGSYIPLLADTMAFHPAFENEAVLWALALCKQRQGQTEVARFLKQIVINEILDLKAIIENRPMDVTIAKEVVPR